MQFLEMSLFQYAWHDDEGVGRQVPPPSTEPVARVSSIELTDIVPPHADSSNPAAYYQPHQGKIHSSYREREDHQRPSGRPRRQPPPPNLRQVAGLRSALAYCTMRSGRSYRQL